MSCFYIRGKKYHKSGLTCNSFNFLKVLNILLGKKYLRLIKSRSKVGAVRIDNLSGL